MFAIYFRTIDTIKREAGLLKITILYDLLPGIMLSTTFFLCNETERCLIEWYV